MDRDARPHAWIEGDLDGALARARANGTATLAWWTAHWCPPCNELKHTIFDHPAFAPRAARLSLVRLDGDAPGAQAYADRLEVVSYPSPLLLDAGGRERMRLPGGFTADELCALLDRVMSHDARVASLVERSDAGDALSEPELDMAAHHWWGIDPVHAAGPARMVLLMRLYEQCPPSLPDLRFRLLVHALWAASRHADSQPARHGRALAATVPFLLDRLASRRLRYSHLYPLLVAADVVQNASADSGDRARLDAALLDAAEDLRERQELTHTENLITLSAITALRERRDGRAEALRTMVPRVQEAAAAADRASKTFEQRQTAMNMAGHLLKQAGLVDDAERVFRAESETSVEGTYFMSYLADIAFERRDHAAGLEWLRRAWQENRPGAARFARGVRYVSKAAELLADRPGQVESEAVRLLAEQAGAPDAFQGLNRKNLRALLETLRRFSAR